MTRSKHRYAGASCMSWATNEKGYQLWGPGCLGCSGQKPRCDWIMGMWGFWDVGKEFPGELEVISVYGKPNTTQCLIN